MRILVTGATGSHGSTGLSLAKHLLKESVIVRAMVHSIDERSKALETMGCEIVQADFHNLASLRIALADVDSSFFSYPIRDGVVNASANFSLACKEVGMLQLVHNTMIVNMDLSPSPFARQNFLVEQIFNWAGLSTTNLRSGFFYQNLLRYSKDEILNQHTISWPMGSGETKLAWINAEDVALVASKLLLKKESKSQTLFLTGPNACTFNEIASTCSEILKKEVRYQDENEDIFISKVSKIENNNPTIISHLKGLSGAFRSGISFGKTTETLKNLTGTTGMSFSEFLTRHLILKG